MGMTLTSNAFSDGELIPSRYTCDGEDLSPSLSWNGIPENTKSLSLIVDDPDAPDPKAPVRTWVHWVLYNLPPGSKGLAEGAGALPSGTGEALNDWKRKGYGGPCPPIGRHRYFFKLYALSERLSDLGPHADKAVLEQAMRGKVMAQAQLMGTYQRSGR